MSKSDVWSQVHSAYDSGQGKAQAWDDVHRFYGGIATSIKLKQRGVSLAKLRQVESETTQRNRDRMALAKLKGVQREVAERNEKRKIESAAKAKEGTKKPGSMISDSTAKQLVSETAKIDKDFEKLDKAREAVKNDSSLRFWKKGQVHTVSNKKQLDELITKMVAVGELDEAFAKLLRKKDFNFSFYDYKLRKTPKTVQLEKIDRFGAALDRDIESALGDRYKNY